MSWAYRNPPTPEAKPEKDLTLEEFSRLLPTNHRGQDDYTGVYHKAVHWEKKVGRYVYAVTCSCGAVIEVSGMVVP